MDRALKEKAKVIDMLLDFVQTDLSKVELRERKHVLERISYFVSGGPFDLSTSLATTMVVDDTLWAPVVALQETWREFLEWFLKAFDGSYQVEFPIDTVFAWGPVNKGGYFTFNPAPGVNDQEITAKVYDMASLSQGANAQTRKLPPGAIRFFECLDGFPVGALRRCPFCNKLFFNPSKRDQVYCSARCRTNAAQRRLRAKQKANNP